jgi:aspartate-semialdehyde dehydrogenase
VPHRPLRIALVGATGAVGRALIERLEEGDLPVASLRPLASEGSAGEECSFLGEPLRVEPVRNGSFRGCDLALLATPPESSRRLAPAARSEGALVVDCSSAFRADPEVPLILPELNPGAADRLPRGIAAVPCALGSALSVVLQPLAEAAGLVRCSAVALEPASAGGQQAIDDLEGEVKALMNGMEPEPPIAMPFRLAFNLVPLGFEREEELGGTLRRLLAEPSLAVALTALRVPIFYGQGVLLRASLRRPLSADAARELLARSPGVKVVDQPSERLYPMPMLAVNDDAVLVGLLREEPGQERALELFLAFDNLRRGAATTAVRAAALLAERHLSEPGAR